MHFWMTHHCYWVWCKLVSCSTVGMYVHTWKEWVHVNVDVWSWNIVHLLTWLSGPHCICFELELINCSCFREPARVSIWLIRIPSYSFYFYFSFVHFITLCRLCGINIGLGPGLPYVFWLCWKSKKEIFHKRHDLLTISNGFKFVERA